MKNIEKATDLVPDGKNANKGTVRGSAVVGESLDRYGAGRSVLADKNGKLIAGNTTSRAYIERGNEDVIVVKTDGSKLVVVQRTDLDLDSDAAARELAHADNRTNQLGYTPDIDQITRDMVAGADLGWLWRKDEIESLKGIIPRDETDAALENIENMEKIDRGGGYQLVVMLKDEKELNRARKELSELGYNFRG